MSVSKKDFVAEARDIREHLADKVPAAVLLPFVEARCVTLASHNPLFQKDKFVWACIATTEGGK